MVVHKDVSSRNPALLLSEEAQDRILDYIRPSYGMTGVAQRTYASFCLVSRHWLSSGRRALYREPLRVGLGRIDSRSFLAALESNRGLGLHVRGLEPLAELAAIGSLRLAREAWEFAVRVFVACPFVSEVSLPFWHDPQSSEPDPLPLHLQFPPTLISLTIRGESGRKTSIVSFLDWFKPRQLAHCNAQRLHFEGIHLLRLRTAAASGEAVPSLPFRPREIVFKDCEMPGPDLIRLLPIATDHLVSLTLGMEI